ncbi:MAG: AAA family ATPase [Oligoflexia bacterium]|nr:AAA family ATPase [Oligoflexia bacterium]
MFKRLLAPPKRSFFLFGPRGVGKSTWLRSTLPEALTFDLLDSRLFLSLSRDPGSLEERIGHPPRGTWICIDEIQRAPELLNEVHRLMELKGWNFALSGSSARKLRRGGANLLAGRAITVNMEPFTLAEVPGKVSSLIEWGSLPLVILHPEDAAEVLATYVHTYVREEIREEGLVRRVEPFLRFLQVAGALNGMQLNASNIAREAQVPRSNVDSYFSILEDTLMGHFLPAYQPKIKVREQTHAKFYWFDPGVARAAAGLSHEIVDGLWLGRALETLIFHELRVYNQVSRKHRPIRFYRTKSGTEVDFLIETRRPTASSKSQVVCIEVKHAERWDTKWETPIRSMAESGELAVNKMLGVYLGKETLSRDGFEVLPVETFLAALFNDEIF